MKEKEIDVLREALRSLMDGRRYRHTLGVEKEMRALALALAPELLFDAAVAALLHDVTKRLSYEEQIAYCKKHGLSVDADEHIAPALLHAKTGAHFAQSNYPALATDAVCDAILRHTTAYPPLNLLSAMLFVADFTEETREYPDCIKLREQLHAVDLRAQEGMHHFKEVLLSALDLSLEELLREGRPIALKTVEARNAVLQKNLLF